MPQLAERLDRLSESATLKMARLSRELKNQGAEIINLSVGEPDFDTPRHIKDAAIRAINDGVTSYPPVPGFPELRKAVADKYQQDLGLSYEPSQVVVSTGGKQTLINILMTIVDPGDEIVLPAPYWVSYPEMIKMVGGELIPIPTTVDVDYKITPEQLQAAITDKTRAVMLCSPSNPTGSVYSEEELKQLAAVLEQYPDLYIISDEIYEYINFRGTQHSIAQFGNLQKRTMIVSGVSKGFAINNGAVELTNIRKQVKSSFGLIVADAGDRAELIHHQIPALLKSVPHLVGWGSVATDRLGGSNLRHGISP
jgi:aspartate aminotransferase